MVTCTTPPFRAAVRLNSGVRPHRHTGKHVTSTSRIAVLTVLMLLGGLYAIYASAPNSLPSQHFEPPCDPVSPNVVRLGPPIHSPERERILIGYMPHTRREKAVPAESTVLREFETPTTGGHLLIRGDCVVGQFTKWIR